MAAEGGASALLVFPPAPFTLGQSPQMAIAHFKRIADATDLPLIVFQYPLATGQGYPQGTLLRMCGRCRPSAPSRTGSATCRITSGTSARCRACRGRSTCSSTHSAWLLSSLVLGCNGLLSGSGSVIPDLQAQLFRAVQAKRPRRGASALNDRIEPLTRVFYADPFVDMHNRMKEALVLLGRCRARSCGRRWSRSARRDRAHPPGAGRGGIAGQERRARRGVGPYVVMAGSSRPSTSL